MSEPLVNVAFPTEKPTVWHSTCANLAVCNDSKFVVAKKNEVSMSNNSDDNVKAAPKVHKQICWHTLKQPKIEWNKIKQGCNVTNVLEEKLVRVIFIHTLFCVQSCHIYSYLVLCSNITDYFHYAHDF